MLKHLDLADGLVFGGSVLVGVGLGWWIHPGAGLAALGCLWMGLGWLILTPSNKASAEKEHG